ncbi:hypothetical protein J7363_04085 [Phaeobacter italicus]|uniref:hypothetical protein n=1 Tax=Phaeobacter italicus TaxID=481446 RepID=UPI001ADAA801|nr:hypothetical protein [Phaeobacter italicus]MBO9441262.1 hypothetical protein [Phaeobacter italicus]
MAAEKLGWSHQTAEFAKGASCAQQSSGIAQAADGANDSKVDICPECGIALIHGTAPKVGSMDHLSSVENQSRTRQERLG